MSTARAAVEDVLKFEGRSLGGYNAMRIIHVNSLVSDDYLLVIFENKESNTRLVVNIDKATGALCEFSEAANLKIGYLKNVENALYRGGNKFSSCPPKTSDNQPDTTTIMRHDTYDIKQLKKQGFSLLSPVYPDEGTLPNTSDAIPEARI